MSTNQPSPSYRAVIGLPGVGSAFTASLVARLSYAMFPLALILAVESVTNSYVTAGSCVGVFAITSILMPLKSRAIDRYGQRRVLSLYAGGFFVAVGAAALCVQADVGTARLYISLSTLAGLVAPPIGPCVRALWAAGREHTRYLFVCHHHEKDLRPTLARRVSASSLLARYFEAVDSGASAVILS